MPGLSGGLPGLSGGLPGLSGGLPGLSGGLPGLLGGLPGLSGGLPGLSGLSGESKDTTIKTYGKGSLNPLLKETIKRVVSIDSQYRDKSVYPYSTNFTFNLSETLSSVVSCGKCRKNFTKNLKKLPLRTNDMESRESFSKYVYNLHEVVNTMLQKKSGLSYEIVRET